MQTITYVAIYFVIWWLCLFAVLPFGVRSQGAEGPVTDGTDPGAPVRTHIVAKLVATTILSFVVTALVFWGLSNEALQNYWNR